ncbi:ABC transporter ATP-binding protein [Clostridium caseinilyticum]
MKKENALTKMFEFAGNYKYLTIMACVLSGISTVLSMIPFICIYKVIRSLINNIGGEQNPVYYGRLAVVFAVLSIFIYFVALYFSHLAAFRTAKNMKKETLHHLMKLPMGYFQLNGSGKIRKIIDDNAGLTEEFLAHQLPDLVGAFIMPIAIIIFLFIFDWRMGIVCFIPLILSVIFIKQMMGGENKKFMGNYMDALEDMNKEAVEYIRGIPIVKVFQQTVFSFKNFHKAICDYRDFASGYALLCRVPMTSFTISLNSFFVLLIPLGIILFINGGNTVSTFLNLLFYMLFTPLCGVMMMKLMFTGENLLQAKEAVKRINELLEEKPLKEAEENKSLKDFSIEFKNVSFSYPNNKNKALNNINIKIQEGQTVAIVGSSGGGKSTIASLIPRFFDVDDGSITIGGVNVKNIPTAQLMKNIAFVFQDSKLFKTSILENIKIGKEDPSQEEIYKSLEMAQCKDIIEKMPDGINTMLKTEGTYLSGGEKQRLALARAILKSAPIIILDEATASSDAENEYLIQRAFEKLTIGKTVIMIAHRLSTIVNADKIIVMDKGKIIEEGTHDSLIFMNGAYAAMWKQYKTSIDWEI